VVAMPPAATVAPLVEANNAFGFALWVKARTPTGNLAMSPASLTLALTMTWAGARAETATQMQRTLQLRAAADSVVPAWGSYAAALQSGDRKLELRVANRLFGEQAYELQQPFLEQIERAFGAPLEKVDFRTQPEPARTRINSWVAEQTNQRIKDLLPGGAITPDTRLVLVNAIYFLAEWLAPFDKAQTRDVPFFTAKAASKPVSTMHQIGTFRRGKAAGVSLLELPYQGDDAAMLIVLPDAIDGLAAVERSLGAKQLATWRAALTEQQVAVALPRFEIDPATPLSLAGPLEALGMTDAFSRSADFSGIAKRTATDQELFISSVFHKAFVKTDEKGTEAAAATAVVMAVKGALPPPATAFKADHPFLFFIVEKASGLVLFIGRVADPAAK
nr:serpin family protein [Myxococcota bacterium]